MISIRSRFPSSEICVLFDLLEPFNRSQKSVVGIAELARLLYPQAVTKDIRLELPTEEDDFDEDGQLATIRICRSPDSLASGEEPVIEVAIWWGLDGQPTADDIQELADSLAASSLT